MTVSNAHLVGNTRVWDGLSFQILPTVEAKKLEKQGLVQISENLTASQLKTAAEFNEAREAIKAKKQTLETKVSLPPGVEPEPAKKPARKKRQYKTRQMKAE